MFMPPNTRRSLMADATRLTVTATGEGSDTLCKDTRLFHRFTFGNFEVTSLLAGHRLIESPHDIFGLNVSEAEFAGSAAQAGIRADILPFVFTPTLVNTGRELVLFDTGLTSDGLIAALNDAGYGADEIDVVVISHMHDDHIGGLCDALGRPTFPKARYVTGAVEFDAWDGAGNRDFDTKVRPLADKMRFVDDGGSIASGITAVAAFGHTPGHMTYMIESDGAAVLLTADLALHDIWSLAHPDWEVFLDMDKPAAAATRKRILGMLACEQLPFIGYHMPWPALGTVEHKDSGFRYVPAADPLVV